MSFNRALLLAALAASAAAAAPAAHADDNGWIVRGGITVIDPEKDNLKLSSAPVTTVQVKDKTGFTFDVTKLIAPHWGIELLLAAPYRHEVGVKTVGSYTKLGSVQHLPPTLSLQWHANPHGKVNPYFGIGLNYTKTLDEKPATLDLGDSFGVAVGGGIDFGIGEHALLNLAIKWIDLDLKAKLGGSSIGTVNVDPLVYGVNFGWRFGGSAPVVAAKPIAMPVAAPAPAPVAAPPPDSDRDGVIDAIDKCPNSPPGSKVDATGCEPDTDGDGVVDSKDQCPGTPKGVKVGTTGCPCDLTASVKFKTASAELTAEGKATLDDVAEQMKAQHFVSGVVEGHTDSVGKDDYNQKLSERRAASVRDYLAGKGFGGGALSATGYGESKPVADNATAEGRAQNRRVVLRRTDCSGN